LQKMIRKRLDLEPSSILIELPLWPAMVLLVFKLTLKKLPVCIHVAAIVAAVGGVVELISVNLNPILILFDGKSATATLTTTTSTSMPTLAARKGWY